MIEAVIFDVDGTLVDTVVHEIVAWHEALTRCNYTVSRDEIRRQIGKGADQLLPALLPQEGPHEHDRVAALHTAIFRANHRPQIRAFPMVAPLFQRLRDSGIKIALGSSGDREDIDYYQRLTGTTKLVDAVACKDDVAASKPDPAVFDAALLRMNIRTRQRVLAVGDTIYDAQAAAAAGLNTIGVLGGAFSRDKLRRAGCIAVYRDVTELYERLQQSPLRRSDDGALGKEERLASLLLR